MPTFDELGVAYGNDTSWYALFAPPARRPVSSPRSMPTPIAILADADMKERATKLGFRLVGGSPEKLGAICERDRQMGQGREGGGAGAEVTRHSGARALAREAGIDIR